MRIVYPLLLALATLVICPQSVTAKPRHLRRTRGWSHRLLRARQLQRHSLTKHSLTKQSLAKQSLTKHSLTKQSQQSRAARRVANVGKPKSRKPNAVGQKLHYKTRFAFLRRVVQLAVDPAHRKMTPNSKREAVIGATLEARGQLPGPITRESTGRSEFTDARGVNWDVKGFNSNFPQNQGGFLLPRALKKLRKELAGGENVILDGQNLRPKHQRALKRAIKRNGWSDRIIWFP